MSSLQEELSKSLYLYTSGSSLEAVRGEDGITRAQVVEPIMGGGVAPEDQEDPFAIAGPVEEMGVGEFLQKTGQVFGGAAGGTLATAIGTAGDIAGLAKGVTDMIGAEEGQKFTAFLQGLSDVSSVIGSERTIQIFEEGVNALPISDEAKSDVLAGSKFIGEVAGIPVGGGAILKGAQRLVEPGTPPAMAPNVPSAMDVDIEAGETMLSTPAKRQDLKNLLDEGAPPEVIDNHPAVVEGVREMTSIPKTNEMPDYGTPEFWENRQYTLTDGTPVVGREAAVDRLIDEARTLASREMRLETPVPTKFERKAIIILGPPAAGKSTLANPIAAKYGATIIDGDEAKKIIPGFENGVGAGAVHEESSALIDAVKDVAIAGGENVVFPKVGGSPGSIRRLITELKEAGYNVDLMEMQVTPDEAMRRMYGRFASKGRLIPPDVARAVGDGPSRTFDTLVEEGIADGYTRIDNNPASGAPRPVIRDDRGILEGTGIELLPVSSGRGSRNRNARGGQEDAGVSGNDQSPSAEKISGLTDRLRTTLPEGAVFDIEELDGAIRLNRIVIPKEMRGQGSGSDFMQELVQYADDNNLKLVLTAAGDFGGSKAGQTRLYKRFGFKENKGRNKDFEYRDTMIREPQQ